MPTEHPVWCLLPAAGTGQRMGGGRPKQYLPLAGRTLLEITLTRLYRALPQANYLLVLHPQDNDWPNLAPGLRRQLPDLQLQTAVGGAERADSVLAGLQALAGQAAAEDWILVHDVARPCFHLAAIRQLWQQLQQHPVGGLLATPLADTLKRANTRQQVECTLDRNQLWQAQTPQMFRYGPLLAALQQAQQQGLAVTDEASAMELAGYQPQLVTSSRDNLKITHPEDLPLAEFLLTRLQSEY